VRAVGRARARAVLAVGRGWSCGRSRTTRTRRQQAREAPRASRAFVFSGGSCQMSTTRAVRIGVAAAALVALAAPARAQSLTGLWDATVVVSAGQDKGTIEV